MDQKTVDTYNQLAHEYDAETADFWERFPRTFVDQFIELTKPTGGKTLDIGSGPGRDGVILQRSGLTVVCLDASATMVQLASARGLQTVLGDFSKLPFADNSFDAIWAYTALLHVPKTEVKQPLSEIRRVLKPQGFLGLGLIEGEGEGYQESAGVNLPRWFSYYRQREIEALLQQDHFQVVYFETFKPRTKRYLHFIAQKNS